MSSTLTLDEVARGNGWLVVHIRAYVVFRRADLEVYLRGKRARAYRGSALTAILDTKEEQVQYLIREGAA